MSQYRRFVVGILIIVLLTRFYKKVAFYKNEENDKLFSVNNVQPSQEPVKKILFWYEHYTLRKGQNRIRVGVGQGPAGISSDSQALRLSHCPYQCDIFNRERIVDWDTLKYYDAIVFHQHGWTPNDVPMKRWPHQHYIFLSMESSAWRFVDTKSMANFFNRTMTYRRDSDIFNPYGWFKSANQAVIFDSSQFDLKTLPRLLQETHLDSAVNYATGKTRKVAWFVSNCKSLSARNEYVDRLKTFIDVDIYGQCGNMSCSRSNPELCRQMLERDYKFYLSLENTLCEDYVTEKFFDQMRYHIIPIVFDLHGHHARMAPPHSYINAADYQSVRELADYLTLLDGNDILYNEYFWWKKHYASVGSDDTREGMCRLCDLLHDSTVSSKTYRNMTDWWDVQSKCQSLTFMDKNTSINDSNFYWKSFLI
ncbi:alpha-(1,3)-fucosyltransferase C-like [Daphnia pulex]|uniref:alpha-(1,3)-fucosyltransferase C-like n=1 Tax=Daphnia pulex TaxID=6669 RepID=UPI001EE150C3|nr:alpha-(1,3)-fucosyltransferase C-like [Daphnia pulex]